MADEEKKPEVAQEEKKEESKTDTSKDEKKEVPAKFKKLVEEIEKMSVLDLSEFVKVLEEHFGVSAAPVAVAGGAPAAGGDAQEEAGDSGKTKFTVVLKDGGAQKINAIKAVREISGLGLAESKALVDGAPKTVKEDLSKEEAEEAKKKLEEAGATVELE
jgi:large subunit ribosomal protein L7/L12